MSERHQSLSEQDDNLVRGCIEWDRNAQNMLYEKYCAKMIAVCIPFSRSREEAEDTFHEGFMKVFQNIKKYNGTGSLEGWMRKIMVNTAIDKYKKNSHLFIVSIDENPAAFERFFTTDMITNDGAAELIDMIRKLPPVCRMVFNLFVFEGMKHRDIAKRLDISEGTSKSNLSHARSILKRKISENFEYLEKIASPDGRK
jgi:RNA polymerase sigma factor (sigma-70 family)